MTVEPLGESALILRHLPLPAYQVANLISEQVPGLSDVVPAYETVGVYFDAEPPALELLEEVLANGRAQAGEEVRHEIPVCYDMGEDLEEVADRLGLAKEEVIGEHGSLWYRCFAIGFCPGFPYLGELPERLRGLPRMPAPRVRVEPGSVAVTGNQTGIYPLPRPGGWWILGLTPLDLVDVEDGYFPIKAGDLVRFVPVDRTEFDARRGERL